MLPEIQVILTKHLLLCRKSRSRKKMKLLNKNLRKMT